MLQFVSNQVGDFPELFDDQMNTTGPLQTAPTPQRPVPKTPTAPQTPTQAVYQNTSVGLAPSQSLNPQSLPLTPPLTPVQTVSVVTSAGQPQQVTRTPPLLQPRPHTLQSIQPQPQPQAQVHSQGIPMQTQSFPVHTLVQTQCQTPMPIQTQAPQTVMITSSGGQSRFIQNPLICHQSPAHSFQGNHMEPHLAGRNV